MIKKVFICLISLCVMVTSLSGCGKELTDEQKREASNNRRAYTYYNELVRIIFLDIFTILRIAHEGFVH